MLMFGSYSVCNIIVLLNMLIAMMSNSYTIISERSDMEWKFARSEFNYIIFMIPLYINSCAHKTHKLNSSYKKSPSFFVHDS